MTDEEKKVHQELPSEDKPDAPKHPEHSSRHAVHHDNHDERLIHQMDTNGFGHHENLHKVAEKRFHSAALAYCYHRVSGGHDVCIEAGTDCPFDLALFDAYRMFVST